MNALMQKLIDKSTIKFTAPITESKIYGKNYMIPTEIPILNMALSGSVDGGISPGLLMIAGNSKHFKTGIALLLAAAYMKKEKDAVLLFYDSEFGSPAGYFQSFGVDMNRVVHTPITNVEQLKFDLLAQLESIDRKDKVIIIIDSIGNLASKKEIEDAIDEKSVADMTRAKAMKSLGRIITPYLTMKQVTLIAINHIYKEIGPMYPKDIVGGGTGLYLSANDVWIMGRQQDKDDKTKLITAYDFIINIDKSRYVREKSKFPLTVAFEGGVQKNSGLFEFFKEEGFIKSPSKGYFTFAPYVTENMRQKEMEENEELWKKVLASDTVKKYIEGRYKFTPQSQEVIDKETGEITDESDSE